MLYKSAMIYTRGMMSNLYSVGQKIWYLGKEGVVISVTEVDSAYYYEISQTYWVNRYTKIDKQLTANIPEAQLLPVLSREQREGNEP
jgi:hypothetical protein